MFRCHNTYILDPPVIIIKIDGLKTSTTSSCKLPNAVCMNPFLEQSCIGCQSSIVFDIVSFLSIVSGAQNKLDLAAKVKQRWRISSMNRSIGNGEKLTKLFASSRIIIFGCVRSSNTNFSYAIAQCCSITINVKKKYWSLQNSTS